MPHVDVSGLTINCDVQGEGEPLLLIPCVCRPRLLAFQLPAYTEHLSCIAIDLPGTGESDKPPGPTAAAQPTRTPHSSCDGD